MSLPDLAKAVADLQAHTQRRDDARQRRRAMDAQALDLDAIETEASAAIDATTKLVQRLAAETTDGKR